MRNPGTALVRSDGKTRVQGPTVIELAREAWRGRLLVLAITLACVAAMVVYLNIAPYRYTASLKMTTIQSSLGGTSGSLGGALGSLGSLANVRLPQTSAEQNFLKFNANLVSRTTADGIMRRRDLLQGMFPEEWDSRTRSWVEPRGTLRGLLIGGRRLLGIPVYPWRPPDAARVQYYLEKRLAAGEDTRKPIVTISYAHEDPAFAVKLVEAVTAIVDDDLRRRSLERARGYITYLADQLRVVQLAESRAALATALGEQERTRMLASSNAPFAAEPMSRVAVSQLPTSPQPLLYLVASVVLGAALGVLVVLVRAGFRASRST